MDLAWIITVFWTTSMLDSSIIRWIYEALREEVYRHAHLKVQTLIIDPLIDYYSDGVPPIKAELSEYSLKTSRVDRTLRDLRLHLRPLGSAYLQFSSLHRYRYRVTGLSA